MSNEYSKFIQELIDWIMYVSNLKEGSLNRLSIKNTEKEVDIIIEFSSSDTEKINKMIENIVKYKKSDEQSATKMGIKIVIRKEQTEDKVKVFISFILSNKLVEIRKKIMEEIERQNDDLISVVLKELKKKDLS